MLNNKKKLQKNNLKNKKIKERLYERAEGYIQAEIMNEKQLNFHYGEIDEAFAALKWIKKAEKDNSLREIVKGCRPSRAEYSAGPIWKEDYDSNFSIKVQINKASDVPHRKILAQFSRFGEICGLYIGEFEPFIIV